MARSPYNDPPVHAEGGEGPHSEDLRAEMARLRGAEAQLGIILQGVQDGITVQVPDGSIVYA